MRNVVIRSSRARLLLCVYSRKTHLTTLTITVCLLIVQLSLHLVYLSSDIRHIERSDAHELGAVGSSAPVAGPAGSNWKTQASMAIQRQEAQPLQVYSKTVTEVPTEDPSGSGVADAIEVFHNKLKHTLNTRRVRPSLFKLITNYAALGLYPGTKIPRVIHQQWKTSVESSWLQKVKISIKSFRQTNQDSLHILWDDDDIQEFVKIFYPDKSALFDSLPLFIHRADLFRYMVLETFGGVYSDVDTRCICPISKWNDDKMDVEIIVGVEADPGDREDWAVWYARQLQWCQWTIASARGHPTTTKVITSSFNKFASYETSETEFDEKAKKVMDLTGPGIWTDAVNEYIQEQGDDWKNFRSMEVSKQLKDLYALTITGFSPGVGHMGSKNVAHPQARVEHMFMGSWKN